MLVWIGADRAILKRLFFKHLQARECLFSTEGICAAELAFTIINNFSLGELNG